MISSIWRRGDRAFLSSVASRFAVLFGLRFALPEGQWRDGALQLFEDDAGGVGILKAATPIAVSAGSLLSSKDAPRYNAALQLIFTMGQVPEWREGLDEFFRWVSAGLDEIGEAVRAEAVASVAAMSRAPRIRCSVAGAVESIRRQLRDGQMVQPDGSSLVAILPSLKADFWGALQSWIERGFVDPVTRSEGIWTTFDEHLLITWAGEMIPSAQGQLPGVMFVAKDPSVFRESLARLGLKVAEWRLSWYQTGKETPFYLSSSPEPLALAMFKSGL